MPKKLVIDGRLPGLNDYIAAERTHRQKAAELKRDAEQLVTWCIRAQLRGALKEPVYLAYLWIEKDRRRDKDNISSFGRKVIQDALVRSGRLRNDGWDNIRGFSDEFAVDKKRPRIEITIYETEGKNLYEK